MSLGGIDFFCPNIPCDIYFVRFSIRFFYLSLLTSIFDITFDFRGGWLTYRLGTWLH